MAEAARKFHHDPVIAKVAGIDLLLDPSGAVYWHDAGALIVADLHLEKGSSLAGRGVLLPPYDSDATLAVLSRAILMHRPKLVIALGDSFHDGDGPGRLSRSAAGVLLRLMEGRDWVWITGNHDDDTAAILGGTAANEMAIGPLTFRHEPQAGAAIGEIAGHLHPAAKVRMRGRSVRRRCFASDGQRLIVPAFGAYTGGLNVRDNAFAGLFQLPTLCAYMIGVDTIYPIGGARLVSD